MRRFWTSCQIVQVKVGTLFSDFCIKMFVYLQIHIQNNQPERQSPENLDIAMVNTRTFTFKVSVYISAVSLIRAVTTIDTSLLLVSPKSLGSVTQMLCCTATIVKC